MAHFAELDSNNVVKQVIVVSNADTSTAQGEEKESIGIAFCERLLGGIWVKTSYNATIRKNYAGIGFIYDKDRDAFIPPKPYNSWVLNESTCLWDAPVAYPTDVGTEEAPKRYTWDEPTKSWELVVPAA
jgi:hypothetical protein